MKRWPTAALLLLALAQPVDRWQEQMAALQVTAPKPCLLLPQEGTAVLLENAATPHWYGALQDGFRVAIGAQATETEGLHWLKEAAACIHTREHVRAGQNRRGLHFVVPSLTAGTTSCNHCRAGTRVLLVAVVGSILHQPPLAVLLQQCAIMALVANNSAYCASPLLVHPLTQRRLVMLTAWLDTTLVVPLATYSTHNQQDSGECQSAAFTDAAAQHQGN